MEEVIVLVLSVCLSVNIIGPVCLSVSQNGVKYTTGWDCGLAGGLAQSDSYYCLAGQTSYQDYVNMDGRTYINTIGREVHNEWHNSCREEDTVRYSQPPKALVRDLVESIEQTGT